MPSTSGALLGVLYSFPQSQVALWYRKVFSVKLNPVFVTYGSCS